MNNSQSLKQRQLHLLHLKKNLEYAIYEKSRIAYYDSISDLAARNAQLLSTPEATFMYNGVMYHAWYANIYIGCNKVLHVDLMKEAKELIDSPDFDRTRAERNVLNYVENALVFAQNAEDMYNLIPSRLRSGLNTLNRDVFNIGQPKIEEELNTFKEKNKNGILAFRRLFLERILLN
jgi:hypothetical protein